MINTDDVKRFLVKCAESARVIAKDNSCALTLELKCFEHKIGIQLKPVRPDVFANDYYEPVREFIESLIPLKGHGEELLVSCWYNETKCCDWFFNNEKKRYNTLLAAADLVAP